MQLTRHSDYALRVLMLLATRPDDRVRIEDLSAALQVSENHLRKVVNRLSSLGVVSGRRGRQGGLLLAKEPSEINVGALIRQMEHTLSPIDCRNPPCRLYRGCQLRGVLHEAMDAFLGVLDRYTLKDLLDEPVAWSTLKKVATELG